MSKLDDVADYCEEKLGQIERCFKPGKKITLLVRSPENDNADFLLTTDDLAEVLKAVQRRKDADAATVKEKSNG